ncbi:MAG: hypothetical protein HY699_08175 [Deltaproteobacteria bacterium]|nr:hypothetical protein [Deltaproteobacteria bacterium]
MNPFDRQTLTLAFPTAHLGAMPAAGGGAAAGLEEDTQQQLAAAEGGGPYAAADTMGYDEVIDPRELRDVLLRGLRLAAGRSAEAAQPARHTGIRP